MAEGLVELTVASEAEVMTLIRHLGHDPHKVQSVHITPRQVEVIYVHPIVTEES